MSQNEHCLHTPNGRMQTLRMHVIYSNRHCSVYLTVCGSAYAKRSLGLHIATTVTVIIIATNCLSNYSCNTNIIMELNEHIEILHSHQQVDKKHTNAHRHTKQLRKQFIFLLWCLRIGADQN